MPIFELDTNVERSSAKKDVKPLLAAKLAELLGVKSENMAVVIRFGQDCSFADHGNSKAPCGNARITSLKGLGVENNARISSAVADILEEGLGIARDKYYIIMGGPGGPENVGFNGSTFYGKI